MHVTQWQIMDVCSVLCSPIFMPVFEERKARGSRFLTLPGTCRMPDENGGIWRA
jgi:hypothetical protein